MLYSNNEHVLIGNISKGESNQFFVLYSGISADIDLYRRYKSLIGALPLWISRFHAETNILTDIYKVRWGAFMFKIVIYRLDCDFKNNVDIFL